MKPETSRRYTGSEPIPLSFAQQRMWLIDQLAPGIAAYNICGAVLLSGRIDLTALFKSFDEIVRRHEVLRAFFPDVDGTPEQVIRPSHGLDIEQINLTGHDDPDSEVLKALTDEALLPFDLSSGPLVRAKLLKLAEDKHVLLVTMHHIISDAWSIGIFVREFAALYNAFSSGRESPLPELAIQYADFAQWQREWLQGEVLREQLDYWKEQLGGKLPVIELPVDRPRPAVPSFKGAHFDLRISSSLPERLKSLSHQHGVTIFMTLVAAFKVLLHRYGGQEDVIVGIPIANRNRSEIEGLIGFFINTLVLRTDLSGGPSFITLLNRVRDVALAAYAHQDLPFEKLVEELHSERYPSHHAIFQVLVVFQNTPMAALELDGLQLEPLEIPPRNSKFDLTLELSEEAEGLQGRIIYSVDLFDAATVERITGDVRLTYGELNRRSNQLARYLKALGVAAESHVGLCCEPGINVLVAQFAVMKASVISRG